MVQQSIVNLLPKRRGFHLITSEIEDKLPPLPEQGILQLFLQHSSAAITINENADPSVRLDFNRFINQWIPEDYPYTHTYEGADDMPAHIKSSIIGVSISVPITESKMNLGTWQGIYLGEFRNNGGARRIVATILS